MHGTAELETISQLFAGNVNAKRKQMFGFDWQRYVSQARRMRKLMGAVVR